MANESAIRGDVSAVARRHVGWGRRSPTVASPAPPRRWPGGTLACLLALALLPPAAEAFAVDVPASHDAATIWHQAPRWSNTTDSLVERDGRGLGGGLEYSIDPSFCATVIGALADLPKPSCAMVTAQLEATLALWGEGHPLIRFTNVTAHIAAAHGTCKGAPQGAEIDFFAGPLSGEAGEAGLDFSCAIGTLLVATDGRILDQAKAYLEADVTVRVEKDTCLFLADKAPKFNCASFTQILAHEVGHALGIMHPDDSTLTNLDNDTVSGNPIHVDCLDPARNLTAQPAAVDSQAMMIHKGTTQGAPLSPDDLAARNFLYPVCGALEQPTLPIPPLPRTTAPPPPPPPRNSTSSRPATSGPRTSQASKASPDGGLAVAALVLAVASLHRKRGN